jgi:hypothetical protein
MAAGLFGALGAIGDTGNQVAEGRQIAHEEIVRRLAEQQAQQAATLNQARIKQQIETATQNNKIAQQPIALGTSYVSGGKTLQRFQDPMTGKVTVQELPGGAPETKIESTYRGLKSLGLGDEEATQTAIKMTTGKTAEKREVIADSNSSTGWSAVYKDTEGEEIWRQPGVIPPRQAGPQQTVRTTKDQYGNESTSTTIRTPIFGGAVPLAGATGRYGAPPAPLGAIRGAVGLPAAAAPQGGQPAPQRTPKGGTTAGPYKGLDAQGNIPENAPVNPQVREFANNLMQGADVNKIPVKARALAESVARKYGWKGQGALTPAQQMQITQVDSQLKELSKPEYLKLFDSTKTRLSLAMLPLDPTTEGGFGALKDAAMRGAVSQDAAKFYDDLTRLRGVITGIRSFTGANNSNATADRLLAELPTFTNTTNSKDALYKLSRLQQELDIIKRLGYFQAAQTPAAAPAAAAGGGSNADNPLNLNLPVVQ